MNEITPTSRAADEAALNRLQTDWQSLNTLLGRVEADQVQCVNLGREIGLYLQGLSGHKQIRFGFFEQLAEKFDDSMRGFDFNAAQKCVYLANTLPEPVKTLAEARNYIQPLFLAGGFIEVETRVEPQKSHEVPPTTFFGAMFGKTEVELKKRFAERTKWDAQTRESVRGVIDRHKKFLEELEQKL